MQNETIVRKAFRVWKADGQIIAKQKPESSRRTFQDPALQSTRKNEELPGACESGGMSELKSALADSLLRMYFTYLEPLCS